MNLRFYTHESCLDHIPGFSHAENPGRLRSVLSALAKSGLYSLLEKREAPPATKEQVLLAHEPALAEFLAGVDPGPDGYMHIDGDTVMSQGSWLAALRGTGAMCEAVDSLIAGEIDAAFCATRPPGHHATRDTAMGFCLINHIAIAAIHARQQHRLSRIAVVDFDVHHGNGTQDILSGREGLMYISTHQSPLYPGSGTTAENRPGNILNIPLPTATDGCTYREVCQATMFPALDNFQPELVLVSAGFDAHHDDPLASMALVEDDYYWLGEKLRASANRHAGGKLAAVLEGGYQLEALGNSVVHFLRGILDTGQRKQ